MIYVGTCGYAYKDWVGPFYPPTIRNGEMLGYYAARFSAVEIDASYYGVPAERTIASFLARTPQRFRFSFKAPQTVTHPGDYGSTRIHSDGAELRERLTSVRDAGRLAAVLLQFPGGFAPDAQTDRYLDAALDAFDGLPLVAEFRNRAWQTPETAMRLRRRGVGFGNVDLPALPDLPVPAGEATSPVGYVRFHGRNATNWKTGDVVTRYDYSYLPEELTPWLDRIAEIDAKADDTYVFFNNHAVGQAAGNAATMERLLEERYGGEAGERIALPGDPPPVQPGLFG